MSTVTEVASPGRSTAPTAAVLGGQLQPVAGDQHIVAVELRRLQRLQAGELIEQLARPCRSGC